MPNDFFSEEFSTNIFFNRAISDEAIGLGERGKKTDGFTTVSAEEAPNQKAQHSGADET
jgi:hypothetical protein